MTHPPPPPNNYLPDIYPNTIGEEAYKALLPIINRWGDAGYLWVYVNGLAVMLKDVDDISRDGPNGEPGWSQVFDLTRMKTTWMPWAGQLVGYQVPSRPSGVPLADYDSEQRAKLLTRAAWRNGTNGILHDVVAEQLNDPKRVIIQNRVDDDANKIKVWIYEDDIATTEEQVEAAARSQKAIGLLMEFSVLTGGTYDSLRANNDDYQEVFTKFVNYNEVLVNPDKV